LICLIDVEPGAAAIANRAATDEKRVLLDVAGSQTGLGALRIGVAPWESEANKARPANGALMWPNRIEAQSARRPRS